MGFQLTTPRSRVPCSTDWTSQTPLQLLFLMGTWWHTSFIQYCLLFFKDLINLFDREWEGMSKGKSRGTGRSRFPTEQGACCRAQSLDPEIMTWAKGRHPTELPRCLCSEHFFLDSLFIYLREREYRLGEGEAHSSLSRNTLHLLGVQSQDPKIVS